MEFAKKFKNETHFYETSCKTGDNVEEAVNDLVIQIYSKYIEDEGGLILEENKMVVKKKKCC